MDTVCADCGTEPRVGARFCDGCGATLAAAPHTPEFKQVTVLFADVVRSMDLAAELGTERLREVMSELYRRCRAVVRHYGGFVGFTGDGIMAVFGAPVALEDHAFRACLAAQDLQTEAATVAADVQRCDGAVLQMRVGLNSGQVIAGEIGSAPGSYTTIGAHVGLAQRMESAAPPGGVMLSESTARLVEDVVEVGAAQRVQIKNTDIPVSARLLVSTTLRGARSRPQATLVGRDAELRTLRDHLDAALCGAGGAVGVAGPPGIGKSRLVDEVRRLGEALGAGVVSTFCEAHARDVPLHAAARLFRNLTGVAGLQGHRARGLIRAQLPDADPADLHLLDELLNIADPDTATPAIDPDARRRRLAALLTHVSAARAAPVVYVIEDVHWMDQASESLIAEFLASRSGTHALALITYRPEYRGRLVEACDLDTITLLPLGADQAAALITELLGPDPSVAAVATQIAGRAAGNPFFAEEIVRDLAERGVLQGCRGSFTAGAAATVTGVPATLQSTIAARIDRLGGSAKTALNAAAVIGSRFGAHQLADLVDDGCLGELVAADMVEPVRPGDTGEYAFAHPLIRAVAYESQLRSERSRMHRRLAVMIEADGPGALDENAALIASHLEGAGDLRAAFDWHMRAGNWQSGRNGAAAQAGWRRAVEVAERLPVDSADRTRLRIAARTALCGSAWRSDLSEAMHGFEDLRRLCVQAHDLRSLATGMSGHVMELTFHNRPDEASVLADEMLGLLDQIGDDALSAGASFGALVAKWEVGAVDDLYLIAQTVIDLLSRVEPVGNPFVGSPMALAVAMRGVAGMCQGRAGWKDDLDRAIRIGRSLDPLSSTSTTLHKYAQVGQGALCAGADALRDTAASLAVAQRSGDDFMVVHAHMARGIVLVARKGAEREAGYQHLQCARDFAARGDSNSSIVHIADIQFARRMSASGDVDGAVRLAGAVVDALFDLGSVLWRGPATSVLVEALLRRDGPGDLAAARAAIDRTAADCRFVLHEVMLLRLRALVARAEGNHDGYRRLAQQYGAVSRAGGFDGHCAIAATML